MQWAWDPALEFKPTVHAQEAKGKGKGKWLTPPQLPKTADAAVGTSSSATPGIPAGLEGISKPDMDVDEEEGISTSETKWESVQLGDDNYDSTSRC